MRSDAARDPGVGVVSHQLNPNLVVYHDRTILTHKLGLAARRASAGRRRGRECLHNPIVIAMGRVNEDAVRDPGVGEDQAALGGRV